MFRALRQLALAFALFGASAEAQDAPALPGDEGPLDNDCFQPTSLVAAEHLARGDQVYARLCDQPGRAANEERAWVEVFESWRAALTESAGGAAVPPRPRGGAADDASPWPDPDGTAERRTEGVEYAVGRRLAVLDAGERAKWRERFESLAAEELQAAGRSAVLLAGVERLHPATRAATAAALRLADLAFEEGRASIGLGWLERATSHLALIEEDEAVWRPRIAVRRAAFEQLASELATRDTADTARAEPWRRATDLRPLTSAAIAGPVELGRTQRPAPAPGVGLQPGLCFFTDGTVVVQAPERVLLLEPEDGRRIGQFLPAKLVEAAPWAAPNPEPNLTTPPGWPLLPASDGAALVLVQGRAVGLQRNVLMCVDIESGPDPVSKSTGPLVPTLRWALMHEELYDGDGPPEPSGLGIESPEFQPGPLVVGTEVLVQVREHAPDATPDTITGSQFRTESEIRSWVVAVDLATGRPRWKRFVAKGVPIARSEGRFAASMPAVSSALPVAAVDGKVFAGTQIGAGALLDLVDGRVAWNLLNRRRPEDVAGWAGGRPVATAGTGGPGSILWAPADGDFAYWLRAAHGPGSEGPLLHPPRHIGESVALIGGDAERALVLGRAGRERTLSAWDAVTGGRYDAPYLGPGETFTGFGLASDARALFATEHGLYLLDRERELYLLDYAPLQRMRDDPSQRSQRSPAIFGGSVFAHDDRVYVLGPTTVWIFEAS